MVEPPWALLAQKLADDLDPGEPGLEAHLLTTLDEFDRGRDQTHAAPGGDASQAANRRGMGEATGSGEPLLGLGIRR